MPPSRRGTGFTNLQQYLSLNQGAAGQMGNAIAAPVEQAGQQVAGDIQTAEFNTLENIKKNTLDAPGQGLTSKDANANAGRIYDGPLGIDANTYADIAGRAARTQAEANALNSNTGRATLLGQKYGQTSWGGGQLDAALAGAGSAGGRVYNAAGSYGRLVQQLGGAQANAQAAGREAASTTAKNAQAYGAAAPGLAARERQAAYGNYDREVEPEAPERQPRPGAGGRAYRENRNAGNGRTYIP